MCACAAGIKVLPLYNNIIHILNRCDSHIGGTGPVYYPYLQLQKKTKTDCQSVCYIHFDSQFFFEVVDMDNTLARCYQYGCHIDSECVQYYYRVIIL